MPDFTKIPIHVPIPTQTGPINPTPAPVPPTLYQFYLQQCIITNTRSVHEDTLVVGLGVLVTSANTVHSPYVLRGTLGDHNNTTFSFWEKGVGALNNVAVGPDDLVTFLYEIYNNGAHGHPNGDELSQLITDHLKLQAATNALEATNPTLAQELVSAQQVAQIQQQLAANRQTTQTQLTTAVASIFTGGLYGAFYSVIDGCDGIVAAGTYSVDGKTLAARVASAPNNVITQTDTSNGKQNGWGAPCNPHGSNYVVSWIAQRQP